MTVSISTAPISPLRQWMLHNMMMRQYIWLKRRAYAMASTMHSRSDHVRFRYQGGQLLAGI